METRKRYYENSHLDRFDARVVLCQQEGTHYRIILDETAFYPEGGGQAGDTGTLGEVRVLDTREQDGAVVHICDGPLNPGQRVHGQIDYARRFHRMQQHSGEHMVSGIIHSRYGYHNTGFHMGADCVTIDFDGVIQPEDLPGIEAEANRAVWQNLPVRCWYPSPEELPQVAYRTKKALPWPVRIVEIPGIDRCACCGTHVAATGEIGLIKLFSAVHFRGGTRIEMACGAQALDILNGAYQQNRLVSQAFSAKIMETGGAAQRMNELAADQKYRIISLERRLFDHIAQRYAGAGDVVCFEEGLDGTGLWELALAISQQCGGRAAVFSGSDETGYGFCLAQPDADLRRLCREMTQALAGRGGGKSPCQQGRVQSSEAAIRAFFAGQS